MNKPTRKHAKKQRTTKPSNGRPKSHNHYKNMSTDWKNNNVTDASGFLKFGFRSEIISAIGELGYKNPTAIQSKSMKQILHQKDLLGCAQTGTGKTAAFALPVLQRLSTGPKNRSSVRALILAPTR